MKGLLTNTNTLDLLVFPSRLYTLFLQAQMSQKYTNEYHWDNPENESHAYLVGSILECLSNNSTTPSSNILDVGCGGGFLLNVLHEKGYRNIWGFDLSESGVRVCKDNFLNISHRFFQHNAYISELPSELNKIKYDVIISAEVIEHLYDPEKYLRNINSWLNDGGCLILTTPYHGYLKNFAVSLINGFDAHVHPLRVGGHIKFFSKSTLYKLLEITDYDPQCFKGSGRLPYLWKSMVVMSKKIQDCRFR